MGAPRRYLGKRREILIATVGIVFLSVALSVMAQKSAILMRQPFQKPEVTEKPIAELLKPLYVPQQPLSCESFAALVDTTLIEWQKMQGTYLIVIARSGEGEKAAVLNRSRLTDIEFYLKQRYNGKAVYIIAQGTQVKGLGRLEFYVGGKLLAAVPVQKNYKGVCSGKVNPFL